MRIIVVGGGKVGYSIAKQLSNEDHHVTVIDNKESVMKRIEENLNVLFVFGNGASIETLTNAGIKGAGMLISVTGEDEMNIVCCLLAKSFGVKYTIARIRNPEYSAEAQLLQEQTGIGRIINPELVTVGSNRALHELTAPELINKALLGLRFQQIYIHQSVKTLGII